MSTLKLHFVILSTGFLLGQCALFKRTHLPFVKSNVITYQENLNVENKFGCAGMCALQTPKCKGYFYHSSTKKCEKIDFDNNKEYEVNFGTLKTGFLDTGKG